MTAAGRIYLDVPQANPIAQRALHEFRMRQPTHIWVDGGIVDLTRRFWVTYEPPYDEQAARAKTREILEQIKADGIDIAGISVPK